MLVPSSTSSTMSLSDSGTIWRVSRRRERPMLMAVATLSPVSIHRQMFACGADTHRHNDACVRGESQGRCGKLNPGQQGDKAQTNAEHAGQGRNVKDVHTYCHIFNPNALLGICQQAFALSCLRYVCGRACLCLSIPALCLPS